MMVEIQQALDLIAANTAKATSETVSLRDSVGRYLSDPILSDVDSPPHDKSLMDGFAVRHQDVVQPDQRLEVIETVTAGQIPGKTIVPFTACRIMTGAPMPQGADCVVMVERTTTSMDDSSPHVIIHDSNLRPGQHVMRRAQSMQAGEKVYQAGHRIRPHDIGLLAEVGAATVAVFRLPTISILATGDELVDCNLVPPAGKIRNSNGPMLAALARQTTPNVVDLGYAKDVELELRRSITNGIESDVLILSGGVSAGIADLVPKVLNSCGVQQIFHQVSIKPGKPIWFGVLKKNDRRCHVFGLPGNPVSTLVCFEVFVMGCLQWMLGASTTSRTMEPAILKAPHVVRGPRPTYWPMRTAVDSQGIQSVQPLDWQGSSDLKCLGAADALALFPPRDSAYPSGAVVSILKLN